MISTLTIRRAAREAAERVAAARARDDRLPPTPPGWFSSPDVEPRPR